MYLNVISFKNGKTLPFQTKVPFSLDKLDIEWIVVTDEVNGQILSFKTSEVVTIANAVVESEDEKPTAEDILNGHKGFTVKK